MAIERDEMREILQAELKPVIEKLDGVHKTLYSVDGRKGLVVDVHEALQKAKEHELILRGHGRTSGMIGDVNRFKLWAAGGGGLGILAAGWQTVKKIFTE